MPSKTHALVGIAIRLKSRRLPCYLCGQKIDYSLPSHHSMAFTVDHIKPRKTHPHLENVESNCVPAHFRCNRNKGDKEASPGLGTTSRDW